jgi:hypothetical protein
LTPLASKSAVTYVSLDTKRSKEHLQEERVRWTGFKPHIITNYLGDIIVTKLTTANTDDRKPDRELTKRPLNKLYADKGYISKVLTEDLKEDGITAITTHRKNMKPKVLAAWDRAMLSKRFIIETIND